MSTAPWHYHAIGNPDNPTLLFLHGFMGNGRDWLPIAKHFEDDYYCVMPDLPGHGKNLEHRIDELLGYSTLAKGLLGILDISHSDQVSLIGYSMGGRLALYFATHYGEKVRHLILESVHPGLIDLQARSHRAQVDLQRSNQIEDNGIESFVDSWYQMAFFGSMQNQPEAFTAMKIARKENVPKWMAKVIRELSPGLQPALWDKLSNLSMVSLLIAGAQDDKYVNIVHKTAEQIPQAVFSVIPNVGHNTHFEAPKEFCKRVTKFLGDKP